MRFRSSPSTRQRGLTMFGFLFVAIVLVFVAMLAMKLVPAYIEFFSVKKMLLTMGQEATFRSKSNGDIRKDFSNKLAAGYVKVVGADDLEIDRSSGTPVVSVTYEYRTKLVGNVSLVVDFHASTDPAAAPPQIE
jgi:uncharacterized membrane protein